MSAGTVRRSAAEYGFKYKIEAAVGACVFDKVIKVVLLKFVWAMPGVDGNKKFRKRISGLELQNADEASIRTVTKADVEKFIDKFGAMDFSIECCAFISFAKSIYGRLGIQSGRHLNASNSNGGNIDI